MNILILTTHLNIGGIPRYVLNLAKFLKRRGENVFVGARGGSWQRLLVKEGINFVYLPLYTKSIFSFKILRSFFLINRFLKVQPIEIIHANTRVTQFLAYLIYKTKKIPYICSFHGCYRPHFWRKLLKCEGIRSIAVSNYVKTHLIEKLKIDRKKVKLIYNGIEIRGRSSREVEAQLKQLREKIKGYPLLGTVCRLTPEKNVASLIRMLPYLLKEFPQAKLLILGEGRDEYCLRDLVKNLNLEERVIFLKRYNPLSLYRILDIFISLSKAEPFGLSLIEAQAEGVVSIVSNSGAFPEVVKDRFNGIILKEETPQSLIEAIHLILDNPDFRETLKNNARRRLSQVFNVEIMGENTYNLYKEVLSKYGKV